MNYQNLCGSESDRKRRRGPSSYTMQDPDTVFQLIELQQGDAFLDIGCGAGDYTFHGAGIVGYKGVVRSFDKSESAVGAINADAEEFGISHVIAQVGDIMSPFAFDDEIFDVCLAATVLHCADWRRFGKDFFGEVRRVLRNGGVFGVLECSKEDLSYGPGERIRIDPEELAEMAVPNGFGQWEYYPMGFNYLMVFYAGK